MSDIRFLRWISISILVLALFHLTGIFFLLYSYYWWYDIPLHLWGGFCVGLFSIWLVISSPIGNSSGSVRIMLGAIVGVVIFGFFWEFYEYAIGATSNSLGNYPLDTFKDMVMDVTGGYLSSVFFRKFLAVNKF